MKVFEVTVKDEATYLIGADNEDRAKEIAVEWFSERAPEVEMHEVDRKTIQESLSSFRS